MTGPPPRTTRRPVCARGHARGRVRIVFVQRLVLEQRGRKRVELAPVLLEQREDLLVGFVDDAAHLVVEELLRVRRDLGGAR